MTGRRKRLPHTEPHDRVLALSVPDPEFVREVASRLSSGGLAVLGDRDEVFAARACARDLPNVLFHPGPPEEIPFEDAWFTKAVDFRADWDDPPRVAGEILRVLVDGGRVYLPGGSEEPLTAIGFRVVADTDEWFVLERPDRPRRDPPPTELPVIR